MIDYKKYDDRPQALKRKFVSALAMLLVSTILMGTTSYAWLVLSTAPEVTGISTNVGANGSLEVALLNKDTRTDMTSIRTGIDSSLSEREKSANENWGNLVDLSIAEYGLGRINLMPARLSVMENRGSYVVNSGLLSVPTYGYDGRIVRLSDDTMSAVFQDNKFTYEAGTQDYGVRAIGTADDVSAQASALALARSNVATYTQSASNSAVATLDENGMSLFSMMLIGDEFKNKDVALIRDMIDDLETSVSYIEMAVRQGIVGFGASIIADETTFVAFRDVVVNPATKLSELQQKAETQMGEALPEGFATWIAKLESMTNSLNSSRIACGKLTDDSHTWTEIREALVPLLNPDEMYINETKYSNFDKSNAMDLIGTAVTLTLYSGSGLFSDIADFAGDYESAFEYLNTDITVKAVTKNRTYYLSELSEAMKELTPAGGGVTAKVELNDTFGYTLDLAFRSNAAVSDLLLQTAPEQRIYNDSTAASTMGGGSYMEFTSPDSGFSLKQMLWLMDAVRVAFVDDQNNILAIAKLNTSNREDNNGVVKAPLYLYEYSFEKDPDTNNSYILKMGQRLKNQNTITALVQNTPKAISVVVWLDGDIVDNTMVAAETSVSLEGVLNLQFSSSANLVPAGLGELMEYSADKNELKEVLAAAKEIVDQGQGMYTTESWKSLITAYELMAALEKDPNASQTQIFSALSKYSKVELVLISETALQDKIGEIRELMGKTDTAVFALKENEEGVLETVTTYPETEVEDNYAYVYRVDQTNNQIEVGNGLTASVYTDESWENLAQMLYEAEILANQYKLDSERDPSVKLPEEETEEEEGSEQQPEEIEKTAYAIQINDMISALEMSKESLRRQTYFRAYEFEGALYYFTVVVDEKGYVDEDADTYGNWLDASFQPVISDKRIIDLDIRAEEADIARIEQNDYVSVNAEDDWFNTNTIVPMAELRTDIYPELDSDEIYAIHWASSDLLGQGLTVAQRTALIELKNQYEQYFGYWGKATDPENPDGALIDKYFYPALCVAADEILAADNLDEISAYNSVMEEMRTAVQEKEDRSAANASLKVLLQRAVDLGNLTIEEQKAASQGETEGEANAALVSAVENAEYWIENWEKKIEASAGVPAFEWTYEGAQGVLDALNDQLVAAGKDAVTEDVVIITIPSGSDKVDHGYLFEESMTYYTKGQLGEAKLTAVILTKNGVIYEAEKSVVLYTPAGGVQIQEGEDVVNNNGTPDDTEDDYVEYRRLELEEGDNELLNVKLFNKILEVVVEDAEESGESGEETKEPVIEVYEFEHTEDIATTVWASTNEKVVTVDESGIITAKGAGSAWVQVSVITVQGNEYIDEVYIEVTEAEAQETEPTQETEDTDTTE